MAAEYTAEEMAEIEKIRAQRSFLGHPKGTGTLCFMQLCNSFGNYGMSAILIYYMYLAVSQGGLGLSQTDAAQLTSLYSAVSVLAGLVGSYMADRILGARLALGLARSLQAFGYICLCFPSLGIFGYAASQILLVVAAMISGRSLDAIMGKTYAVDDGRRDGAFTLAYVISNIGACAPAITGAVSLAMGYSAGFAFSAVLAAAGAIAYWATQKKFFGPLCVRPVDPLPPAQKRNFLIGFVVVLVAVVAFGAYLFMTGTLTVNAFANGVSTAAIFIPLVYLAYIVGSKKTTKAEKRHVLWLLPLFLCNALTMMLYAQSASIIAVYTDTSVDRMLFGIEISPAAFQTFGAIFAVMWGSLLSVLWTVMGKRQPKASTKISLGTAFYAFAPLLMVLPFLLYPAGVKVSALWIVGFWLLACLGEAFVSPNGGSLASLVAPAAFSTQMMTVWNLAQSTGSGISTLIVNLYQEGSEAQYFLLIGGITVAVGLLCLIFRKKISEGLGEESLTVAEE